MYNNYMELLLKEQNMVQKKPLKDILIIDLTRILAGPYATMLLSDLGARIIKIEPPGGDDSRNFGPMINGDSIYFSSLNRGKESIVLNLKNKLDRKIFENLLVKADVLIENFRPGTMKKLGYGWEMLSKKYPQLIYAACSGFGQTGPWSKKPAYDMIVQGMGGLMSLTGHENQEPARVGTSIGDITAGIFTVIGIQTAIIDRYRIKKGQMVDISMLDCQIAILENAVSSYFATGKIPGKSGSRHPSIAPFECYKSKDGYILIAAGNDDLFIKLCQALKREDLLMNKMFNNNMKRLKNVELLKSELEKTLTKATTYELINIIEAAGVPVGPLNDIENAVKNPQIIARNMIVNANENKSKPIKVTGNPIKLSMYKDENNRGSTPNLDQDREKIIKEFCD